MRVQLDEVEGNLLDPCLGFFLQLVPGVAAEFIYLRNGSFLARVFRDFVQRVDVHIENVAVLINDADRLLQSAI